MRQSDEQVVHDAESLGSFWLWLVAVVIVACGCALENAAAIVTNPVGAVGMIMLWAVPVAFALRLLVVPILPAPFAWLQRQVLELRCHLPV